MLPIVAAIPTLDLAQCRHPRCKYPSVLYRHFEHSIVFLTNHSGNSFLIGLFAIRRRAHRPYILLRSGSAAPASIKSPTSSLHLRFFTPLHTTTTTCEVSRCTTSRYQLQC
jgi:hypothetical protein